MRKYRKLFLIILTAILLCLGEAKKANADFSLGVYPPILQIQADVPTAIKKEVTIVNASENPQDVSIVFKQFVQSPYNNGQISYPAQPETPRPDKDIFQKIQILDEDAPIDSVTLAPKQKKVLTLHIGLPKDEPPGDYYFSILFISHDRLTKTQNGSAINAGIATNVLLSIGPKDQTTGFLEEFSSPWFFQTGPIPFTVSVANTSRHFIAPTGQILIRNMFNQLIGKVDLLPVNILSQTSRFIPSKDGGLPKSGTHPLAYWNEKVLFGPYRANIVISLSDQGPLFTRTIYFFVMPLQYIIGFFLTVTIVSVIIMRVRRHAEKI